MALNAYLILTGVQQGQIKGSVTQKGREGQIQVIAVNHQIQVPRDSASGQATGRRKHGALVITKEVDRATVPLRTMLVASELASKWELRFWFPSTTAAAGAGAGQERQLLTVTLTDAAITSIDLQLPNTTDPELTSRQPFEEVAFAYREIAWTWTDGAVTAADVA